ncbi:MAG: hypothetical protein WAT66_07035 [Actinomycetota bacterium]
MSAADWYIALFSFGSGVGIIAFWLVTFVRGKLDEIAAGRGDIWFHVVAELVTGAVLVAGAVAIVVAPDGRVALALSSLGLGLLVYSLIQSPGHYVVTKDRRMVATFIASGIFVIPAVVLRFVA